MSAISLKSITGITSITTPAGVDNQLTLHNNNTTEAVKLDVAGNLHFHNHLNITGVSTASNFKTGTSNLHNTGLNVQDLDVDGHTNLDNVSVVGVSTFTRVGATAVFNSGAANDGRLEFQYNNSRVGLLAYHSDRLEIQTDSSKDFTIRTNGANERFRITSAGRLGVGIAAPTKLLDIATSTSADGIRVKSTGNTYNEIAFDANRTSATNHIGRIVSKWNGTLVSYISLDTGTDTTNKDDGQIRFFTSASGGSNLERLRIDSSGNVTISTGNLTIPDSIIHSGDTDTKIAFTNNQIDLQCAGASRAYINNYALYMMSGFPLAFLASSGATPNIKSGGTNNQDLLFTTGSGNPTRLQITSTGELRVPAGIGPQLRFENQHSVTTDAAISTFDDASGTLLCLGSNFYMNSSGSETRYNTSEESAGILINRNGYITFFTGSTGATGVYRFGIASDGKVLIDNSTGTLTIGGDNVYDNAKINLMVGNMSQTSATTEATAIVIHDQNSRRNGTEGTGSWKSKIVFRSTQINGNSASEGASIVHDITYNNYSSTKMRSDLVFKTRGDAQTASSDAATEKLRIRHDGLVGINENQPDSHLHVNSGTENDVATFESTDAYAHIYIKDNSTHANGTYFGVQGNDFRWITHNDTSSAERLRLTKMGNIQHRDGTGVSYFNGASEYIFGSTTSSPSSGGNEANVQIHAHKTRAQFSINGYMNNAGGPMMQFVSSRHGTVGTLGTKCISNDYLGEVRFFGDNGTNGSTLAHGATIWARAKSTPADGDTVIAGEINFSCGDSSGGSLQDKMKIQGADGKIKFGPNVIHQLHSQSFAMYPDNGSNNITRLTFTGLIYGTYIAQIGYYNAAGQGYGGGMFHVSGYQTASYTYNVHEIVRWDNAGNSAISAVAKYNSSWVIDITNSHSSYQGAGEVSVYGDAQVTCTVTYHQ